VKPYLLDDLRDRSNSIIERRVAEPSGRLQGKELAAIEAAVIDAGV
jgi:hypothetical protein